VVEILFSVEGEIDSNPRAFADTDVSKGYVSEPMKKYPCERRVLQERRWQRQMEKYNGED